MEKSLIVYERDVRALVWRSKEVTVIQKWIEFYVVMGEFLNKKPDKWEVNVSFTMEMVK